MKLSDRDLDYGIRTILAEAQDQGPVGQAAVAHVIKNRVENGNFGNSIAEVVTKPYQFEPWLRAGKGAKNDPLGYAATSPDYQTAAKIFQAVLAGDVPDPTRGATHFYSPTSQRELAKIDGRKHVPDWADPNAKTAVIGGHEFYNVGPKKTITVTRPAQGEVEDYVMPDYMQEAAKKHQWQGYEHLSETQSPATAPAEYKMPDYMQEAAKKHKWTGYEELHGQKAPALPASPVAAKAPEGWGVGRSFATGATLGAYPYIEAGVEALGDYAGGNTKEPSLSTLVTGEQTGLEGAYNKRLKEVQEQRQAYQNYSPNVSALAENVGSLVPTLPLGVGVGVGASALGRQALRYAPDVVKPALQAAGRFLSGQAGEQMSGITGVGTRALSNATQGGLVGAGQGLATHYIQPDQTWGQSAEQGALGGAVGGVIFNPLFRGINSALNPEITDTLRQTALRVNQQHPGINVRPTQIAMSDAVQKLDKSIVPEHVKDAQIAAINDAVKKEFGLSSSEPLTKQKISEHLDTLGQNLENIAAGTPQIPLTAAFVNRMNTLRTDISRNAPMGSTIPKELDNLLNMIYARGVRNGGYLTGDEFRGLTKKFGTVHQAFLDKKSDTHTHIGYEIKNALFDMFSTSDPVKARDYAADRLKYRIGLALKSNADTSGVFDPTKLLGGVQRQNLTGNIHDLATVGKHMARPSAGGGVRTTGGGHGMSPLAAGALGAAGVLGAEHASPMVTQMLESFGVNPLGAAALGVIGPGIHYAGNKMLEAGMTSPWIGANVLNQSRLTQAAPHLVTSLAPAVGSNLANQVGYRKRKKK